MSRFLIIFTVLAGVSVLSACADLHKKKHNASLGPAQIIYSPTGDPLNGGPLGRPTCTESIKRWFARVDANHDGVITLDEFLNDARTQFQRMDIDKNGYLVSEEVERFRMAYRDFPGGEKSTVPAEEKEGEHASGGHHGRSHGGEGGGNSPGESDSSSVIDPVMSADTDLDYKVTREEFIAYSQKTFRGVDADHNGALNLAEATVTCGARP